MIELDQMKATLSAYKEPLREVGDSLELEAKGRKIEELSGLLESPGFWDDVEKAQKMSRELNELKQIVEGYQKLQRQYEDIEALIEMGYEENDPEMIPEIQAELGAISQTDLDKTINLLRDRAGMPHLTMTPEPDPANNMGVSDLIWEIRRERRVEMMYAQNDRYYSLQRWNQLDKLDTAKYPDQARGAYVGNFVGTDLLDQITVDADGYINCSNGNTRTYDSKYMLFPIPSGQRDLNSQLNQNPGW